MTESTYHVVCRDCEVESLVDSASAAETLATDHEAVTNHRIVIKRVQ